MKSKDRKLADLVEALVVFKGHDLAKKAGTVKAYVEFLSSENLPLSAVQAAIRQFVHDPSPYIPSVSEIAAVARCLAPKSRQCSVTGCRRTSCYRDRAGRAFCSMHAAADSAIWDNITAVITGEAFLALESAANACVATDPIGALGEQCITELQALWTLAALPGGPCCSDLVGEHAAKGYAKRLQIALEKAVRTKAMADHQERS